MSEAIIQCTSTPHHPHAHTPQSVQHLTTKTTGKCVHTGKTNCIDNQRGINQNPENTGNKPAKPEINNKPNMTTIKLAINPNHQNQMNQLFRQKPTGNCMQLGKVNSIDNQQLIYQNT